LGLLVLGCGSVVPPSPAGAAGTVVRFEPEADASAVPSVAHFHVASQTFGAGTVLLFSGELSSYYLSKVQHGDLPDTLSAREIPIASYRAGTELIVAPTRPLAPGAYSLAGPSGLLAAFTVGEGLPLLRRLWPAASGSLKHAVYCAEGELASPPQSLSFEPGDLELTPVPGVDGHGLLADRCFSVSSVRASSAGEILIPAPRAEGWAVDPAPFSASTASPPVVLGCLPSEVAFGLGCATPEGDRLLVRTPEAPLLWAVHGPTNDFAQVTERGAPLFVRGLAANHTVHLSGNVSDELGAEHPFELDVALGAALPHLVLNEVLANPLGPEPQSEWVELVNDGADALELSAFSLRDGGGSTPLPAASLGPGELGLLVREDYEPSAADVMPAADARLLRVPQLGKSGLSNSGEVLSIVTADGTAVSTFPAMAAKAGQSVARRHPWSADGDPSAFVSGTPTPGAANDSVSAQP